MNIYEGLFIAHLVALILIMLGRLYNIFRQYNGQNFARIDITIIFFILSIFIYAAGLIIVMLQPYILLYSRLLMISNFIMVLSVLMLIIEIISHFKNIAQSAVRERYSPQSS